MLNKSLTILALLVNETANPNSVHPEYRSDRWVDTQYIKLLLDVAWVIFEFSLVFGSFCELLFFAPRVSTNSSSF